MAGKSKGLDPIEAKRQKLAAQLLKKRVKEAQVAQERLQEAMEMSRSVDVHDLDLDDADLEVDDADLYDVDLDQLDLEDDESFDGPAKKKKADPAPEEADYTAADFGDSRLIAGNSAPRPALPGADPLAQALEHLASWVARRPRESKESKAVHRASVELIQVLGRTAGKSDSEAVRLAGLLAGAGAALGCLLVDASGRGA